METAASGANAAAAAKKILVVYFSRSGYTQGVAQQLARECRADVLALQSIGRRRSVIGYLRLCAEAVFHMPSRLAQTSTPNNYDLVVIGTPVWCWNMSSPTRAYLERHQGQFKRIAFFCTCGGAGAARVFGNMAALCGQQPVATLALTDEEIDKGLAKDRVAKFVDRLQGTAGVPQWPTSAAQALGDTLAHS